MAQVPYEHIEAPRVLSIDGVRAFNPGDPVPVATARAMGLLEGEDAPPVLPAYGDVPLDFTDGVITIEAPAEAAAAHPSAQDAPATGEQAPTATPTPAPTGATTTAAPPQARTEPPKQGAR